MADDPTQLGAQYIRECTLFVTKALQGSSTEDQAIDLSQFRIKFSIKKTDAMTPNIADIRIYNLSLDTAQLIKTEFKRVILQGGYTENKGVIFQGHIYQVIIGRESAVDTYVDLVCGDGQIAYNFAIVNKTLAAGSKNTDQVNEALNSMRVKGVSAGTIDDSTSYQLPRGKVMFGNAKDVMRYSAQNADSTWSIQDEKVTFIKKRQFLPGEAVLITAKTGMIGTPQQTTDGINIKCLMNPLIRVGGRVKLDNAAVAQFKISLQNFNSPANIPPPTNADGVYYVLVVEHQGDNRGTEWYTNLICINQNITTNPINSVQVNYAF